MWVKHCSKWQACCSWGGKVAWKFKNNLNIIDSCEFYSPEHCKSVGVLPAGVRAGKQQVERHEDLNVLNPLVAHTGRGRIHSKKKKKKNPKLKPYWMIRIDIPEWSEWHYPWISWILGSAVQRTLLCGWTASPLLSPFPPVDLKHIHNLKVESFVLFGGNF